MTNPLNRLVTHPDTLEGIILFNMSDEDEIASHENPQIIRDLYTQQLAAEATKQADLDELRSANVTTALNALESDLTDVTNEITAWATKTNAQKLDAILGILQRERRAKLRERVIIRALWRKIEQG